MKKLIKILIGVAFLFITISTFSQEENERLDEKIDELTYGWDLEADKLSSYEGLTNLCSDGNYRNEIFQLLKDIHHYDTILYNVLTDLSKRSSDKEIAKTLRDIKKFEEDYGMKNFIHFMSEECKAMINIERDADDTRNEVGFTSYSGQVYILETELVKYVNHVTDRVDKIREHVHHLSKNY
ncbi:MAG: hypothetical protein GDA51_08395 [Ekhidna sp.]|nr:hypothetical protein [Ekhidna sp.]MBC6410710.1 hypothetical protein [Ekhidna sp.]MBC6426469.1 hypothetical protein [Ekhidna sp.]